MGSNPTKFKIAMLLSLIIFILFFTIILILVGNLFKIQQDVVRSISLISTLFCFFISIFFWILFDRSSSQYQFVLYDVYTSFLTSKLFNIMITDLKFNFLEKSFFYSYQFMMSFGIDGISLFFLLLSTFIIPLCLLTSYKKHLIFVKEYCLCFLFLELFLIFYMAEGLNIR